MAKKKPEQKPAQTVIQNCIFHGAEQSSEADIKRSEAIKALAEAMGKMADALKGPTGNVGLMIKSGE
jgi:hypothetical protein